MAIALPASPVTTYAEAVLAGDVPAGELVRLACERHMADIKDGHLRGLRFDDDAADRAIAFFTYLKHSKGEWAGTPLVLEPWQQFIVGSLFGWQRGGTRRFRTAHVEVPRKNGKSTLAAGLGLYLAFFDGEGGAEVYAAATKREQAKIVWAEAKRMVQGSPDISKRVQALAHNLHQPTTASKFEALGRDADSMDGLNIHAAIVDELHAHPNRDMVDVLETATGSRRQPLIFYITTAGHDQASVCWEKRNYARLVLEGVTDDDTLFAFIATIDKGDAWDNPATWVKANPNYGVSVKPEDLERKAKRATELPSEQNAFRRLHLNEWTEQAERWIDMRQWDTCDATPQIAPGDTIFCALDMASTIDLSAAVGLRIASDGYVDVLCRFWRPQDTIIEAEKRDGVPYRQWADEGYLELTEGTMMSDSDIAADLLDWVAPYQVTEFPFDMWNARGAAARIEQAGATVVAMAQGFQTFSAPCHLLEGLLADGKLRHGGHPILRWMAAQVMVQHGPNDAIRPFKPKGSGIRNDGIVALLMALARAQSHQQADPVMPRAWSWDTLP